jgi:hypothetical protein
LENARFFASGLPFEPPYAPFQPIDALPQAVNLVVGSS